MFAHSLTQHTNLVIISTQSYIYIFSTHNMTHGPDHCILISVGRIISFILKRFLMKHHKATKCLNDQKNEDEESPGDSSSTRSEHCFRRLTLTRFRMNTVDFLSSPRFSLPHMPCQKTINPQQEKAADRLAGCNDELLPSQMRKAHNK